MFSYKPNLRSKNTELKEEHFKIDFAILSAMQEELEYFNSFLSKDTYNIVTINEMEFKIYQYKNKSILLAATGLGTTFASSIITLVHHHFHPDYIFFSGTAGGINPNLKLRDVIIVEKAFEAEIQEVFNLVKDTPFESCLTHPLKQQQFPRSYMANSELLNIASNIVSTNPNNICIGTVVSSNSFPAPQELFEKIKQETPYSIDMETSAIYQVAWLLGIRVLAVRGISNLLNNNGTDDAIHESDVTGSSEAAAKVILNIMDSLLLEYDIEESFQEKSMC